MARKRITLDVPEELLAQIDAVATTQASTRNQVANAALRDYVRACERRLVDEAFLKMAGDKDFLKEQLEVERQWSPASDEAWDSLMSWREGPSHSASPKTKRRN